MPEKETYAPFFIIAFNLHMCFLKSKEKVRDQIHCKICLNIKLIQCKFTFIYILEMDYVNNISYNVRVRETNQVNFRISLTSANYF